VISTLAGNATNGFSGDGGLARDASLTNPYNVVINAAGGLFVADAGNNAIRQLLFPPVIAANGVVLTAGYTAGPLVPGGIFSIFGSGFVVGPTYPSGDLYLVAGLQVLINGLSMPIYYADPHQINFQAASFLSPGTPANLVVTVGTNLVGSAAQSLSVAPVGPGIFTLGGQFGNQGAILLGNSDLLAMPVTAGVPSQPVHAGDIVSIYCDALGATTPAVASGALAPGSPPATVQAPVSVTIGGVNAPVSFAGLAPGFIGLYQVNAQVPTVPAGNSVPVVMMQGGVTSNTATIAVQ